MNVIDKALDISVVGGFSRIGYAARSRLSSWNTDFDLSGKRILITGGTSGIGLAAARDAVAAGATVGITGRDVDRTAAAARSIGAHPLQADSSDLDVVNDLVDRAVATLGGLDVLVNNAGALDNEYHRTAQGFERTYAVHVVAPFLLTARALPFVRTVITVSSGGMYSEKLDPDTMQMSQDDYDGVTAYARAKRVQVALNSQWAHQLPHGPTFAAMHPGWADTPGVRTSLPRFRRLTAPILRTPEQGADTILWLAGTDVPTGLFWHDRSPRGTVRLPWLGYGDDVVRRTWDIVAGQAGVASLVG